MARLTGQHPDPRALETVLTLLGTSRRLVEHFESTMARHGLSMSRFSVMVRLWQTEGARAPLNEIADWCNVSPRNVTGLVDGLVAAGIAERIAHPDDRRVTLARLTRAGVRLTERVAVEHWRDQASVGAGLDDEGRRSLIDLCVRLSERVSDLGQAEAAGAREAADAAGRAVSAPSHDRGEG
jgi:DNA-binding MarR family transcriptional regulator